MIVTEQYWVEDDQITTGDIQSRSHRRHRSSAVAAQLLGRGCPCHHALGPRPLPLSTASG